MEEKFKALFHQMRTSEIAEKYMSKNVVNVPQPGYWVKNPRILFIAQNPSIPKPGIIPTDAKLLEKDISDDEFMANYLISQKSWYFYRFFISEFITDEKEYAIMNATFFPTYNNVEPPFDLVEEGFPYLSEAIKLINPKNIIAMGKQAKLAISLLHMEGALDENINIIKTHHYAWYMRNKDEWDLEKMRIKGELK